MAISQGAQANKNGKVFENMMIPIFKEYNIPMFTQAELKQKKIKKQIATLQTYVIHNATFTTIYEEKGRTEFVIVFGDRKIRVEAKYQETTGSIDEKYPYMLLNGIYKYPENEIIFVVDGGGYKPGARQWLEDHIKNNWLDYKSRGKSIKLMTLIEFFNWFNNEVKQQAQL